MAVKKAKNEMSFKSSVAPSCPISVKNEMSFKSSVAPSCPISEITTYVCRLKRLETRLIKDLVFPNQESKGTMSYILGVKWLSGSSELGDHEIYQK